MKSYADEGFLAESAQPFFSNLRMVPPETPAGANLFLGELEFERNVVQKPSIAPEMHNTSRRLHKRRESVNKKRRFRRTSLYILFLCQPDGGFYRFVPTL